MGSRRKCDRRHWLGCVLDMHSEGTLFAEMLRENALVEVVRCQRLLNEQSHYLSTPNSNVLELVGTRILAAAKILQAIGVPEPDEG